MAGDLADKAGEVRADRAARKAAEEPDVDAPIAEFTQSRLSNTVHPERIVLYRDRVEHVEKGMVRSSSNAIRFSELAQVRADLGMVRGSLVIESSGGATIRLDKLPKEDAEAARAQILAACDAWRTAGAQPAPPAGDSVGAELERIAGLHERGLLNDDEFAAAKARLLG